MIPRGKPSQPCPCSSGLAYGVCCRPFHSGEPAPTATALMRSRYAAFALGLVDYLLATCDDDHPERALPEGAARASLRDMCSRHKFPALSVLDAEEVGDGARVLFHARVFTRGQDRSFVELSEFRRGPAGWRYTWGTLAKRRLTPAELAEVTIATFPAFV